MAQNILTTVLSLVGGQQYVRSLNQAAAAHKQLAFAQQHQALTQRQAQSGLLRGGGGPAQQLLAGGGIGGMGIGAGAAASALASATIGALAVEIKAATESFVAYDRAVIGTQLTLQRMGTTLPSQQFSAFARQLSLATGTAETDLVNLQGYLARFGTDAPTIERASRTINNAAILTGHSVEEMAVQFEQARRGHAKEFFKELGIPIKGVEGQLYDLNTIVDIVDRHIGSFGERMGKELPGRIAIATSATKAMQTEIGHLFAPLTKWLAETQTGFAVLFGGLAHMAADRLGIPRAGVTGGAGGGSLQFDKKFRSRSEEYLRKIELNTGPQGTLGRALRAGGSFGDTGHGAYIRDFNAMFRHM